MFCKEKVKDKEKGCLQTKQHSDRSYNANKNRQRTTPKQAEKKVIYLL